MSTNNTPSRLMILAAFAAIYLIWGSTYVAILIGLQSISPFMLIGIRFSVAGAILVLWRLWRGDSLPRNAIPKHALVGTIMLFGGTGAVVWVEQYIASGLAAIIVASIPFWFVLLDYKQWSFNFSNGLILSGVLVGFAGIVLLSDLGGQGSNTQLWAIVVLLGGCVCWASGSLYLKYKPVTMSTTMAAGIQMLAAGLFSMVVAWQQGDLARFTPAAISAASWGGLLYLITFGSLMGYLAYVWLLKQRPAVQVGTYAYVNPVVAVLLGWFIAAETFAWQQLAALGVILAGVLLINMPKYVKTIARRQAVMPSK